MVAQPATMFVIAAVVGIGLAGCASPPERAPDAFVRGSPLGDRPTVTGNLSKAPQPAAQPDVALAPESGVREVFPGVRVDLANRFVEFDAATSPALVKDPRAPLMFLEVIACTPDTREHETLVVTRVRPSNIHAALLLVGLEPGEPGGWRMEGDRLVPVDPRGARVKIEFTFQDRRAEHTVDPVAWIVNARNQTGFSESMTGDSSPDRPAPGWVFAGSLMATTSFSPDGTPLPQPREVYAADESGVVIGLATFGVELIGWSRTFSPDASVQEPEWIVNFDPGSTVAPVPPPGTPVIVRVRPE